MKYVLFIFFSFIFSESNSFNFSRFSEIKDEQNIQKEVDEIMIELVGLGWYNTDWSYRRQDISSTINSKINTLHKNYPNSESVNYLALLIIDLDDTNDKQSRINLIKEVISNRWFKTQAFLISGDNYSDNKNYNLAEKDYKKAIEYAPSNSQKGYCYYKLGNIYFEMNFFHLSLISYEKAEKFFAYPIKDQALEVNWKFKDWYTRNKIALYRVKNLLKK